jgi:ferredoxin
MPRKYNIEVSLAPPRFPPVGKFVIERSAADCINCGRCALTCIHSVHARLDEDPRRMAEPEDYRCKGCFRCVQECPKEALTIRSSDEYLRLGNSYWTPEIISKNWYQAETGKVPVSGAGYPGPFSGEGFDSMWTDMSEIVRPTRDGIHGREYINTSVDIGRKVPVIKFDAQGRIVSPLPPTLSVPLPIIFDTLPVGGYGNVYEAVARAASFLGTLMIVDPDVRFSKEYEANAVPVLTQSALEDSVTACKMAELEYGSAVLGAVEALRNANPGTIVSVRVPFGDTAAEIAEELTCAGVEVVHLYADCNGKQIDPPGEPRLLKDMILEVHRQLVARKIRDEVTLIASGGIAIAEHVAKSILCGADLVAIDLPLLIALECRYCKNCHSSGLKCPVALKDVDPRYGAQRIINLVGAWRNQLLEVLGAMGLREMRRLRGELGRAIFFEDIQRETFDTVFAREVSYNVKAGN